MKTKVMMSSPRSNDLRLVIRLIAGAGLMGAMSAAQAAWVIEPTLQIDSRYDDNVRLRPEGDRIEESGAVTTASANARIRNASEVSDVSAILGAAVSRYSGVQSFEEDTRETFFGTLSGERKLTRGSAALTTTYRRMDILRGVGFLDAAPETLDGTPADDLLDPGGDPVDGSAAGLTQRNSFNASPSVVYQATLRTAIGLLYEYSDQTYSNSDPSEGFQDFRSNSGTVQIRHALTERDTAQLSLSRARLEPEVSLESDSWQGMVNWSRLISENITMTLGVGAQRTENDLDDQTGSLYELSLQQRLERGSLQMSVERAMVPNAYGDVVETDRAILRGTTRLSDRWSVSLRLSAYSSKGSLNGQGNRDQEYFQARPELRWAVTENWAIRGGYSYTWVDRKRDPYAAESNAVTVAISYTPPRRM